MSNLEDELREYNLPFYCIRYRFTNKNTPSFNTEDLSREFPSLKSLLDDWVKVQNGENGEEKFRGNDLFAYIPYWLVAEELSGQEGECYYNRILKEVFKQ